MIHRFLLSTISFSLLVLAIASCGGQPIPVEPNGAPATDYASLVDRLQAAGASVEPADEVSQPFFSEKGQVITVNGGDVQVFEYPDKATADAEAAQISADGSSVGTSMMAWIAPPHFYQEGRLIVLYVGDSSAVISTLESALGPQIAGR